jgi:uncharacterized protein (TIGR02996 family)
MATEGEALFRAVCEEPWDDAVRLVYADWLEEHGQPQRADFIRFQCDYALWISSQSQQRRRWWEQYEKFQPLLPLWEKELPTLAGVKWHAGWFDRGFIDAFAFQSAKAFRQHAEAVFAASPVAEVEVRRVTDRTVREVLASPLLARLRKLYLVGRFTDVGVTLVAACPALERLHALCLWGGGCGDAGAEAIARSPHLGRLKCLSFYGHRRIGDRGALALAESRCLGTVTDLVLHGTHGLSRPVVRALKRRFRRLE